jgi:hypothetical protein
MALWEFKPRGDLFTTVAVGVGVLAAPVVVPLAWSVTRPLIKAILKGGFMAYEMGRCTLGYAADKDIYQSASKEERKVEEPKTGAEKKQAVSKTNGKPKEMKSQAKTAEEKPKRQKKSTKKQAEKPK